MHDDHNELRSLIARLNVEHAWSLPSTEVDSYLHLIVSIHPETATVEPDDLRIIVHNVHSERRIIDALRTPEHPDHSSEWEELRKLARKIAVSRSVTIYNVDTAVLNVEDLAQSACQDLWQGLRHYHYESRFRTWAITVITNCVVRHIRDAQTVKRGRLTQSYSLDAMPAADLLPDQHTPSPFDIASASVLEELIHEVLKTHPDDRIEQIFRLWAIDDLTLREIGRYVHLSQARVHTLIGQVKELLQHELEKHEWNGQPRLSERLDAEAQGVSLSKNMSKRSAPGKSDHCRSAPMS